MFDFILDFSNPYKVESINTGKYLNILISHEGSIMYSNLTRLRLIDFMLVIMSDYSW